MLLAAGKETNLLAQVAVSYFLALELSSSIHIDNPRFVYILQWFGTLFSGNDFGISGLRFQHMAWLHLYRMHIFNGL